MTERTHRARAEEARTKVSRPTSDYQYYRSHVPVLISRPLPAPTPFQVSVTVSLPELIQGCRPGRGGGSRHGDKESSC